MQAPKWTSDAQTLSYAAGNSKYIYIYLYSYMHIKKGKIIYRTVSSQRHLEKSKNKSFFLFKNGFTKTASHPEDL